MEGFLAHLSEGTAWMAWTWQTGLFFIALALTLTLMTWLAAARPEAPRVGVLHFPTTRGDRLFLALLGAAFIHLAWIALVGGELGWASGLSLIWALAVFRLV
ncbi:DUF2160 domain-containing protein [Ancylobacter sp. Lp-2]|uniref:DUF2160 domain-containing protein n=1 Tax=Ancylobacter sp. Lp-2 TaxID=2881339 RepID=UPI001E4C7B1E|nr:DUF2160 domain-containing protein [Ancylobacter sp. Lp-2]MCB4769574.1 DUF2160 domain-containing protein [Ancylobacter sp. Lp-2]